MSRLSDLQISLLKLFERSPKVEMANGQMVAETSHAILQMLLKELPHELFKSFVMDDKYYVYLTSDGETLVKYL